MGCTQHRRQGDHAMKVVAFDGSARRDGVVSALLLRALAELEAQGIETELLYLERDRHTGCYMCGQCAHKPGLACSRPPEDGLTRCVRRAKAADGLLIGTPAYSSRGSPATQALLQRFDHARRELDDRRLTGKPAAAVVDLCSDGAARTAARLNHWFEAQEMIVVAPLRTSGRACSSEREGDGAESMVRLGRTMAGLLKRVGG
jgi:multimeric flavodoxin WrbA